jgi:hypothetical protein
MMKQNEQTECAMAVALAVFDFIQLVGDEIVYDVNRAIDLIQEYGAGAGGWPSAASNESSCC